LSQVIDIPLAAIARLAFACSALLLAPAATALEASLGSTELSLRGFGTLGAARSTDGSAELVRDLSQPHGISDHWSLTTDSLFGLQVNARFSPELEAVVQAVTRYKYDETYNPDLSWAFLRLTPNPVLTVRAGRFGTEFYMLSDSRMVGYSYNTVRPPPDYYGTLPFNYLDGLDLAITHPFASGLLTGKLFTGQSREQSPLGAPPDFDLNESLLIGGYLEYLDGPWQIRLGQTSVRFDNDLPLEPFYQQLPKATADELRVKDQWSHFSSLGIVYDQGPFQSQLMLSKTDNEHGTFQDTWAGYLQLNYRIKDWTPFLGLSFATSDPKALSHPIPPVTDLYQLDFYSNQRTVFVGARWDFYHNVCLKAQVDVIRGSADSKFLYRYETEDWDGSMTIMSLALDFVF